MALGGDNVCCSTLTRVPRRLRLRLRLRLRRAPLANIVRGANNSTRTKIATERILSCIRVALCRSFALSSLVPSDDVHGCIHCMSLSLFLIPSVQVAVRVIRIVVVALVLRAMLASCDDFHGCIRPWHVVIALLYYLSLKLPCVTFAMLLLLLSCCTVLHSCCFVSLMARCLPCILGLKWCA